MNHIKTEQDCIIPVQFFILEIIEPAVILLLRFGCVALMPTVCTQVGYIC